MHPANAIGALQTANIDYVCLANNHTLDYGTDGLVETVWTVKKGAKVAFAGAGETTDESRRPAVLSLPRGARRKAAAEGEADEDRDDGGYRIDVFSATDHPKDWADVPTFHMIDYSSTARQHLKSTLTANWPSAPQHQSQPAGSKPQPPPGLKIFSVHWGPNYAWQPAPEIRDLAHFVIDECGVDIVHGHSAHHVQGVEVYKSRLIVYGCGDFVDDYALNEEFRNDLGGVWRVVVCEKTAEQPAEDGAGERGGRGLKLERLEIFPTRCGGFRANLLDREDADHVWVKGTVSRLSRELGTRVEEELGEEGQVVVKLAQ